MATFEEQLIQKGLERGLEQGLAQGREQGLAQGREHALRDALARLLRTRFGPLGPEVESQIAKAPTADLDRLIERVVTAAVIEDVFTSSAP